MSGPEIILSVLLLAAAGAAVWFMLRARVLAERLVQQERQHALELESLDVRHRERMDDQKRSAEEAQARFQSMQEEFRRIIDQSASTAMKQSAEHLLKLTETKLKDAAERADADMRAGRTAVGGLLQPISDTLKRTEEKLAKLEQERSAAAARLEEQVRSLAGGSEALRKETLALTQALRRPEVRGRYGEVQLRRVVELAGMREWCDFDEQAESRDQDGRALRPDVVVRLPNSRSLAVDAKTNISAYLDAIEVGDAARREERLEAFARHVEEQALALGKKGYWQHLEASPEFVVMFIPGDQFIDAALQRRPGLLELAANSRVILASPSTLIGLLYAVHVGWREQGATQRADDLLKLARDLHERLATVLAYSEGLGKSLAGSVEKYNEFRSSLDRRVLPAVRRLEDLGAKGKKDAPEPPLIQTRPTLSPAESPAQTISE